MEHLLRHQDNLNTHLSGSVHGNLCCWEQDHGDFSDTK